MISEVKAGLDDIAREIRSKRAVIADAKAQLEAAVAELNGVPAAFASVITQVQALGTDPSDVVYKDELTKLTAEFLALVTSANGAIREL